MNANLAVMMEEWCRGTLRDPAQHFRARLQRNCPSCGYSGHFVSSGWKGREAFRCPNCSSRPRDRQIALILTRCGIDLTKGQTLHFAPEWPLFRKLKDVPGYVGGDIISRRNANAVVDITKVQFADNSFDYLICNHVLEHVPDDVTAMAECFRVLKPGGLAFFSVPVSDAEQTWNPPPEMSKAEVERICGWDHVRSYGRDFGQLLGQHGFKVTEVTFGPDEREQYSLLDETMYVATKGDREFFWPDRGVIS